MAWATPTITRSRGELFQHTHVLAVNTFPGSGASGTDQLDLTELPLGVIGGSIAGKITGSTGDVVTLTLRSMHLGATSVGENNLYVQTLNTVLSDPDYFPIASVFEDVTDIGNAPFGICTISSSFSLFATTNDVNSVGVMTVDLSFVSVNLDP
jgi:hypothetical protein